MLANQGKIVTLALIVALTLLACVSFPVHAQGGLAMSGSLTGREFTIPPGSEVSGEDIFSVVFNNSDSAMIVDMTYTAPQGVEVVFSESKLSLGPGENHKVLITIKADDEAVPGKYDVIVTATSVPAAQEGSVGLASALSQKTSVTITGDSAQVMAQAVSPDGQPVVATVRLYKVVNGQDHEVAHNDAGTLEARVSPGDYHAVSYIGGQQVAEESFTIAANDNKTVTLSGATVYFEGFGILPSYYDKGGALASTQIIYTVRNLYQPVDKGEVILQVTRDDAPLEELTLATLSPLELGQVELKYNYMPSGGWVDGNYGFKLQLNVAGKPYVTSQVEQLPVGQGSNTGTPGSQGTTGAESSGGGGSNTGLIIGIIAGVAVVAIAGVWFVLRRRRA